MRNAIFILLITVLASCAGDEQKQKNGTDSANDSIHKKVIGAANDSLDSAKVNIHYNCSVLKRRIPDEKNEVQIKTDINDLSHCGVDSFDLLYVIPNLFPGYVNENHIQGFDTITYGDFLKHMNDFKATPAYAQLHEKVKTLDSLKATLYDPHKLYTMKPVLGKLGFTQEEWDMFSGFATTYPIADKKTFTWNDMLNAFDKYSSTAQNK
ncbi:MAG: hypothetical protein HY064_14915 [Bacteroidetes bacterium]|nr:hypothetical protein [Bacteroidota bacterium]